MGAVATAIEMVAMVLPHGVNYSLRYALIVVNKLKYRSSLNRVDRCIAVIATEK
jgi:hypothetical protein